MEFYTTANYKLFADYFAALLYKQQNEGTPDSEALAEHLVAQLNEYADRRSGFNRQMRELFESINANEDLFLGTLYGEMEKAITTKNESVWDYLLRKYPENENYVRLETILKEQVMKYQTKRLFEHSA